MKREEQREAGDPGDSAMPNRADVVEPEHALPPVTMEELPEQLREAAARANWTTLMPVQAKTIPYVLAKRDLMIQSRTGSGKTGAYILPILQRIDPRKPVCQALVLVPTRELAKQVATEAETLGGAMGVRTVAVYGGVSYGPQLEAFRKGAHLVVGTPGRILDHLLKGSLSLKGLRIMVFDEADRMLSMGFYPDMREVQRYLPSHPINGYMFSATFPPHVMRLAAQFLHQAEFLSLSRDHVHVTDVEHVYYLVPPMEKDRCLVRIIEVENPASALIFCNTKARVHYVTVVLQRFGYDADELSSDLSQKARGELKQISKAIGETAYCQIMAALEVGKRLARQEKADSQPAYKITSTSDTLAYCKAQFARLGHEATQEEFHVILLNEKHHVIKTEQITVGLSNKSLAHPREVFRPAIRESASAIILVHNHPSGDPTPSQDDKIITKELKTAGDILGIRVLFDKIRVPLSLL